MPEVNKGSPIHEVKEPEPQGASFPNFADLVDTFLRVGREIQNKIRCPLPDGSAMMASPEDMKIIKKACNTK
jgi:hypothetical protein